MIKEKTIYKISNEGLNIILDLLSEIKHCPGGNKLKYLKKLKNNFPGGKHK